MKAEGNVKMNPEKLHPGIAYMPFTDAMQTRVSQMKAKFALWLDLKGDSHNMALCKCKRREARQQMRQIRKDLRASGFRIVMVTKRGFASGPGHRLMLDLTNQPYPFQL